MRTHVVFTKNKLERQITCEEKSTFLQYKRFAEFLFITGISYQKWKLREGMIPNPRHLRTLSRLLEMRPTARRDRKIKKTDVRALKVTGQLPKNTRTSLSISHPISLLLPLASASVPSEAELRRNTPCLCFSCSLCPSWLRQAASPSPGRRCFAWLNC